MIHSEKLEDTLLWKIYQKKCAQDDKRRAWVKDIFTEARNYLLDVRQTFPNYTLHDGTHILNVLDAMGGILGSQVDYLTVGEAELLILVACLHDLGMVYTRKEKKQWLADELAVETFLKMYCPEFLGVSPKEWSEGIRQWYFRTLHPFRLSEVLQNREWKKLFANCPLEVVSRQCILAVCQAHGENPEELQSNRELEYLPASDVDPLFCALLLRLGDLLDFDDTRAPKVLYHYTDCSEKSQEEWKKHQASAGFRYPDSPSSNELPYKARCTTPGIEHAVRDFLDWIDDELSNSAKLQRYCSSGWRQSFPFPRAISRREIESDGYMSGDFCLTMDQTQILNLLVGENLYDKRDVFVRELLQNAIDATMLRGKMDPAFVPENSRIDLWEWNDAEGNIWFRIDDQGTGMTLGMLQRYFLKVGNSYYTSKELERDLTDHGQPRDYHGISRFGIGFLSCFLNGDYAEVSTLYFDPEKNRREEPSSGPSLMQRYGLRLQVTGLSGYYTLKNQARQHPADERMPGSDRAEGERGSGEGRDLDMNGYRAYPGTSIAIRLNPGKMGTLDLRATVEKYLCGFRVPVYYNNKRIGLTYEEVMRAVHEMEGRNLYELSPEMKEEFDQCFPEVRGQYPKLCIIVAALDSEDNLVLPGLSGGMIKYSVHYDHALRWTVKDQTYEMTVRTHRLEDIHKITVSSSNVRENWRSEYVERWGALRLDFSLEELDALAAEFEKLPACPQTGDQLGQAWLPFVGSIDLYTAWRGYYDSQNERRMEISVTECGCKNIGLLFNENRREQVMCAYQGIVAGDIRYDMLWSGPNENYTAMFLLEDEWRPVMNISRSQVKDLPTKVWIAIHGIICKYQMLDEKKVYAIGLRGDRNICLKEWRKVRMSHLDQWLWENLGDFFEKCINKLQAPLQRRDYDFDYMNLACCDTHFQPILLYEYLLAWLQDNRRMTINYEKGEVLSFYEKKEENRDEFDLFPPMMFCRAVSDQSRRYLCSQSSLERRGIMVDHPFMIWLLNNAPKLNQYYKRQFDQIVNCLRKFHGHEMIPICNEIREQMIALHDHHGVDVEAFPILSQEDFWSKPISYES